MSDRVRCKIDTEVFERVRSLVLHFSVSIQDIQTHVNQYLKDASEDFERQLVAISNRLAEAEAEEKKREEEKKIAKTTWDSAITERQNAETAWKNAKSNTERVQREFDSAKAEKDYAYKEMAKAKEDWLDAKRAQQEAFQDMKNHDISHDEFEEYMDETAAKKDIFSEKQGVFNQNKAFFEQKLGELQRAKSSEKAALNNLKAAEIKEKQAEKEYHIAEKRYEEAKKNREKREMNLKEAKSLVLKFNIYKDDYYHPYYIQDIEKSCDLILTQLRTDMREELGHSLDEIENAVNNILRCSLKEGVEYEVLDSSCHTAAPQKTWEERKRIREGLRTNKEDTIEDLNRSKYEHPNYAERCKVCGRLISLCNCPNKDVPRSLND